MIILSDYVNLEDDRIVAITVGSHDTVCGSKPHRHMSSGNMEYKKKGTIRFIMGR